MLELEPSDENFNRMSSKWTIPVYEANIIIKYYQLINVISPGIHTPGMVFYGEGKDMFEIDWLRSECSFQTVCINSPYFQ